MASGRLRFSTDISDAADAVVHFAAVGTPQSVDERAADLTYVHAAFDGLIPHLKPGDIVVGKSTVPLGTAQILSDRITAAGTEASLAWNPEFLREGFAVKTPSLQIGWSTGYPTTARSRSSTRSTQPR
jgi:UDPglucose 6-dehydrogenase